MMKKCSGKKIRQMLKCRKVELVEFRKRLLPNRLPTSDELHVQERRFLVE